MKLSGFIRVHPWLIITLPVAGPKSDGLTAAGHIIDARVPAAANRGSHG